MSELKKEILDLGKELKKHSELGERKGDQADLKPKDGATPFVDLLKTREIPLDVVERYEEAKTDYTNAAAWATGEIGIPAMEKDGDLKKVTATFPMLGKDSVGVTLNRERQVPAGLGQPAGETKTAYGTMTVKHDIYSTGSVGDLKHIKHLVSERALEKLGK